MEWPSKEVVGVINYLMSGFVAAWVFFGLTAHPKPTPFERVVHALIFTAIIQACTGLIRMVFVLIGSLVNFGPWTETTALIWSVLVAFILGAVFAGLANNDAIHSWLRGRNWMLRKRRAADSPSAWTWTKRTSYPSEWFGAFNTGGRYVVLHLKGSRRLYGWPEEWPDQPDRGHFLIAEAEWLILDDSRTPPEELRQPCENVWHMLVPATEVELVEFMAFKQSKEEGENHGTETT